MCVVPWLKSNLIPLAQLESGAGVLSAPVRRSVINQERENICSTCL